jgi:hypothetical protein
MTMIRNQRLRLALNAWRFGLVERAYDLWNIALPIFLVSGLLAVSARFWLWAVGLDRVLACFR